MHARDCKEKSGLSAAFSIRRCPGQSREDALRALARPLPLRRSRTPGRAATRVALHARTVAHQREVAALAAGFALVALGAGLRALLDRRGFRVLLRVDDVDAVLELLGRRQLGFRL